MCALPISLLIMGTFVRWQTKVPMMSKFTESTSLASISTNWRDYYELCKPQVMMLMILTSVIGMLLAVPGMVPLDVLIIGNLGIALCAGSAAAVNHLVDRQVDKQMTRTINRPVATGRVDPWHARSEEHTSELQSRGHLVCRLLLEKKNQ